MIVFAIITSYRIVRFCSQLSKFELFDLMIEDISEIFLFSFIFRKIKESMISKMIGDTSEDLLAISVIHFDRQN